jgi:hypothetical protein
MVLLLAALALPAAARAADPLGLTCADQGDGIRLCQGKVKTFDGVPLDANLALPTARACPWWSSPTATAAPSSATRT